jgi:hypothetical protein
MIRTRINIDNRLKRTNTKFKTLKNIHSTKWKLFSTKKTNPQKTASIIIRIDPKCFIKRFNFMIM